MAPSTTKQWKVAGKDGFDGLKLEENASIPRIGDQDVLVKSTLPHPHPALLHPY